MKRVAVEPKRATVEISMDELGLLMDARCGRTSGTRGRGTERSRRIFRAGYDARQLELQDVIDEMDALGAGMSASRPL